MIGYLFQKWITNRKQSIEDEEEIPVNIFIMLPAALMDMSGEFLLNTGLVLSRDAGTYQIMRSSTLVWSCLISIPVFKRIPKWFQGIGIILISIGLFTKASIMIQSIFPDHEENDCCEGYHDTTNTTCLLYTSDAADE